MKNLYIFDCFGVVLGEIAPIWFSMKFGEDKSNYLKEKYFFKGDNGEKNINDIINEILYDFTDMKREEIVSEWKSLFKINEELLTYIDSLRRDNIVILLTNAPIGLFEILFDNKNYLFTHFDDVFISGETKIAKPDKEAYLMCMQKYEHMFSVAYMIDDNEKNLKNLKKLGIKPVLYKNNEKLIEEIGEDYA